MPSRKDVERVRTRAGRASCRVWLRTRCLFVVGLAHVTCAGASACEPPRTSRKPEGRPGQAASTLRRGITVRCRVVVIAESRLRHDSDISGKTWDNGTAVEKAKSLLHRGPPHRAAILRPQEKETLLGSRLHHETKPNETHVPGFQTGALTCRVHLVTLHLVSFVESSQHLV